MSDVLPAPTRLDVVERPTWFGPAESPLFGVAHLPADQKVRGAVLICGSLGKDHADALRGLRLLGDQLAALGMLVFRFDYLGTGDSSYGQVRPDSVREWQDSIAHALDYLHGAGITDVSAIAVRAGCVILDDCLSRTSSISRIVYWDPVGTGQRFLREQTAFFKITVGEDNVPPGLVSMIGTRLSAEAARDFAAMGLDETGPPCDRLVLTRSEGYDKRVKAVVAAPGTKTVLVDGFAQCVQPAKLLVPVSLAAIDAATDWLDEQVPKERLPATLELTDSARIPTDAGGFVTERIERIGPHGLFAIRTLPDSVARTDSAVIFFTNANNGHHGPNREWVELSRSLSEQGRTAVRWDRRGAGESGVPERHEEVYIYSAEGVRDALAATGYGHEIASRIQLVGVCSGGWYAAHGARTCGAESVVFVNTLQWSWRCKRKLRGRTLPGDQDEIDWEQTPRARLRRRVQHFLPAFCWRNIGRTGMVQAPEVVLSSLARRGVAATVILCPHDTSLFVANKGLDALRRLRNNPSPPVLVEVSEGDHASYHQSILGALRQAVLDFR